MDDAARAAPRRLALTGDEWAALCRWAGVQAPTGFGVDVPQAALTRAEHLLAERGVLTGAEDADRRLHPSIAANLAIWAPPDLVVQVELGMPEGGLRAAFAVRGPVGGSLFTLPDGGVELSMFRASDLGAELTRAVPEVPALPGASLITEVLAPPGHVAAPVSGRLPLSALADYHPVSGFQPPETVAGHLELTAAEVVLAKEVTGRTHGVLRCLVVSGADVTAAAGTVLAGQVVWLATDAGWVGLRPHPDGSGRQLVDLVPVRRDAIGPWLSPYVAQILEVVGDRA